MAVGLDDFEAAIEWTQADEARPDVTAPDRPERLSERGERVLKCNAKLRETWDGTRDGYPSDSERALAVAYYAGHAGLSLEDATWLLCEFYARPGKKKLHHSKLQKTLRGWQKGRERAERDEAKHSEEERTKPEEPPGDDAPLEAEKPQAKIQPFEVLPCPDYMRASFAGADRLVPGIGLTACGVGVLSGAGGDGKSVLALNLALGWTDDPLRLPEPLRPARPLRIAVFMVEDAPGMVQERLRLMLGSQRAPSNLLLFTRREPMQFGGSKGRPLMKALERLRVTIERHAPVDIVNFDPLIYLHQSEENSASEMMRWLTPLRETCRQAGAALFLTHHSGWAPDGEDARGRGSTAIRAWSDCELALRAQKKGGKELHRLNLVKCNFAPRWGEALTLELDPQTLRFDAVDEAALLCPTEDLITWLTEDYGGAWTKSRAELYQAMRERFGCSERSARDSIARAKQAGRLKDEGQRKPLEVVP